jgi:arginase
MMEMIAETGKISSMEVAEVNPILDVKNSTAEVAAELVASALGKRIF